MSTDEQMQQATFHLVAFDEGGVKLNPENLEELRLVCQIKGGGKLAIWGSPQTRANIDTVLAEGVPCHVRCDYKNPKPWGKQLYGHTHWVPQGGRLSIVA